MKSIIVCGENFINDQNTYTLANGSGAAYLYDQKPATQCLSSGSSEGATWTATIQFKDRAGDAVSRTFDRLILLNHNLSQFYLEYYDGTWHTIAESVFNGGAPNTDTDLYIEIATPVTGTQLRLTATNTIGAVAEKLVGELKACLYVSNIRHLVTFERADWDDGADYRLQGGGLVTFMQVKKVEGSIGIKDMSDTTWQLIKAILASRLWMTIILYADFDEAEIYEFKATDQPAIKFDRKAQLYEVSFKVKER